MNKHYKYIKTLTKNRVNQNNNPIMSQGTSFIWRDIAAPTPFAGAATNSTAFCCLIA